MGLPAPHTATVITPGETTDGYGDPARTYEVPPATTREARGFFQPQSTQENVTGERGAVTWDLRFFTEDRDVSADERVQWRGHTYRVNGQPALWHTPAGFHHLEVPLQATQG